MFFTQRRGDCERAISEFWRWWPTVAPRVQAAIDEGVWDETLAAEFAARVKAIHPGLEWEFAKGAASQHVLVVCGAGDARLRASAERWRAAAPPADAVWAFHSTRQADPGALEQRLRVGDHDLDLSDLRFGVYLDKERAEVDVTVVHPRFASMTDKERLRVAFLALDWALGEAGVEIWVGAIRASPAPPERPQTVRGLRAAVAELEDRHREPVWVLLGGEDGRGVPMVASVQSPLKAARWPRFDLHVAVVLPYRHQLSNGLPADESLAALRAFEDELIALLGGDGELVAHETAAGRRTLHLYVDGVTTAQTAVVAALPRWDEGRATAKAKADPSWKGVSHLRLR